MKLPTIEELVDLFHPDYVGVNNPIEHGTYTPGNTNVRSFHVDYDDADGILLYVDIDVPGSGQADGISKVCLDCINRTHLSCEVIRGICSCERGFA